MKKEKKARKFIPKPHFPGGPRKMSSFIYAQLKYPEDAKKDQIKGVVRLKIEIDYTGKVVDSRLMSGLTPSCNEEAQRVVKLLKFDFHHKLRKGKVRYHKTLNIKFKPPTGKSKQKDPQINYHLVPSKNKDQNTSDKKNSSKFNYTITLK